MNNRKLKIKEKECYELDKRLIVIKIRKKEKECEPEKDRYEKSESSDSNVRC